MPFSNLELINSKHIYLNKQTNYCHDETQVSQMIPLMNDFNGIKSNTKGQGTALEGENKPMLGKVPWVMSSRFLS